jgi:hypothetical protein
MFGVPLLFFIVENGFAPSTLHESVPFLPLYFQFKNSTTKLQIGYIQNQNSRRSRLPPSLFFLSDTAEVVEMPM